MAAENRPVMQLVDNSNRYLGDEDKSRTYHYPRTGLKIPLEAVHKN